jgi:hypothetical protein
VANGTEPEGMGHRDILALSLLGFSVIGITLLAVFIILKKPEEANTIMSAVLPLFGSWVGTILAFYFSKDNFAAATRSVSELTKQITSQEKLQTTLAKDKMIPRSKMFAMPVTSGQKLKDILEKLDQANLGARIPFLAQQDFPKYVIHRSVLDRFLSQKALNPTSPPTNIEELTLDDLLKEDEWRLKIEQSISTVKEDATLADVKTVMDQNVNCQDVFVTKSGTRDEPVLGWITNSIVEENTKL